VDWLRAEAFAYRRTLGHPPALNKKTWASALPLTTPSRRRRVDLIVEHAPQERGCQRGERSPPGVVRRALVRPAARPADAARLTLAGLLFGHPPVSHGQWLTSAHSASTAQIWIACKVVSCVDRRSVDSSSRVAFAHSV